MSGLDRYQGLLLLELLPQPLQRHDQVRYISLHIVTYRYISFAARAATPSARGGLALHLLAPDRGSSVIVR